MFNKFLSGYAVGGKRHMPQALQQIDENLYVRLSRHHSTLGDAILPPLTTSANGGRLWIAVAAALALGGGRRGQTAAWRGLTALAATSAIVNVPVKLVVRRHRPDSTLIPLLRRLSNAHVTSSFPSGHSASAAAFAVAAGLAMPEVAIPLGLLATGVGVSRVYTGAHYPSDVIGGAAIGAGIAIAVHKLAQRRDEIAGTDPLPVQSHVTVPEGRGFVVAINESAGPAIAVNPAEKIKKALPEARILETEGGLDDALREAIDDSTVVVGASGGDGSVNAAMGIAREAGIPLAVVPGGTMNHFARDIGIADIAAATAAIEAGAVGRADTASIAGRTFLNTACIGFYTDLVHEREKLEQKVGKWPAALIALAKVIRGKKPIPIEIDGRRMSIWTLFAGNGSYGDGSVPSRRVKINDGQIDIRVLRADRGVPRLRALLSAGPKAVARYGAVESWLAESVSIRPLDGPLLLAADGEVFDGPGTTFTIEKGEPVDVIIPEPK